MLFGLDDTKRRALEADGFVSAWIADVWIGDIIVWERTCLDGRARTSMDVASGVDPSYDDPERTIVVTNTILHMIVRDEDGILDALSINIDHSTWMKRHPKNEEMFGSLSDFYNREI